MLVVYFVTACVLFIAFGVLVINIDQSPRFARYKWLVEPVLLPLGVLMGVSLLGTVFMDLAAVGQMKKMGFADPPMPSAYAFEHGMYGRLLLYVGAVLLTGAGVLGVTCFGLKLGVNTFPNWRAFYLGRLVTFLFAILVLVGAGLALAVAGSIVSEVKQQVAADHPPVVAP